MNPIHAPRQEVHHVLENLPHADRRSKQGCKVRRVGIWRRAARLQDFEVAAILGSCAPDSKRFKLPWRNSGSEARVACSHHS